MLTARPRKRIAYDGNQRSLWRLGNDCHCPPTQFRRTRIIIRVWLRQIFDSLMQRAAPSSAREHPYMEAALWPQVRRPGAQATVSPESALAIYGLSDVSPAKVHITLPHALRIRRTVPRHLIIHYTNLEARSDRNLRLNAELALGELAGPPWDQNDHYRPKMDISAALPALMDALNDPDPGIRARAEEDIDALRPNAAEAVPKLINLLADPEESVRAIACITLSHIGDARAPTMPTRRSPRPGTRFGTMDIPVHRWMTLSALRA